MEGPSLAVIEASINTFRAMATMRISQVAERAPEPRISDILAAADSIGAIGSVIAFLRKVVDEEASNEDAEQMREMLFAVEVATAMATMGPVLLSDQVMRMFAREWTPQEKFADRWQQEIAEHIPSFTMTEMHDPNE